MMNWNSICGIVAGALARAPPSPRRGRGDQGLVARRPLRAACAPATSSPRATRSTRCSRPRDRQARQDRAQRDQRQGLRRRCAGSVESLRGRQGAGHLRARTRMDGRLRRSGLRAGTSKITSPRIPELYGDIIVPLWQSVSYKGARYGVPQDSEVRMFFLNNDKLRKLGKTDKDIAALPGQGGRRRIHGKRLVRPRRPGGAEGRREIRDPAPAQCGPRLPDAHGKLRPRALRQGGGQAAGVEVRAQGLLHLGRNTASTRRRSRRPTHRCRGTRSSRLSFRRRRGAGLLPRRLARHRPDRRRGI